MGTDESYPPIDDYALLSDCHSVALVSRRGSIDWACLPRIDAGPTFSRLLDWRRGGYCTVGPADEDAEVHREYVGDTLVLATTFTTRGGAVRVTDCLVFHERGEPTPREQLLRVVDVLDGEVDVVAQVVPRFELDLIAPWVRTHGDGCLSATGGKDGLVVSGDLPLTAGDDGDIVARERISKGERRRLSLEYVGAAQVDERAGDPPSPAELDARLEQTCRWWQDWCGRRQTDIEVSESVRRSAFVLKGLTFAPSGAIAASATTSLPEVVGGSRNWDYRFSWVRDSWLTTRAMAELGYPEEAEAFRRFIERSAAGQADQLQVAYGLRGDARLTELEAGGLEGYRCSTPVRAGNAAYNQKQLDIFGELLQLSWSWHRRGHSPDDDYWHFLCDIVDLVVDQWDDPDRGIWEIRGAPEHFVHSKVLCWAALDRGIRLAADTRRAAPVDRWVKARQAVRDAVEERGVDRSRGIYVRAFGADVTDSALLLLPRVGYVADADPRMVRTVDAIIDELEQGGLLRRYRTEDGLPGEESPFVACTFWLVECLVGQGRLEEARRWFDRAAATANDVGLFGEQHDIEADEARGNFPQGISHLSHISAALALDAGKVVDPG